MPAQPLVYSQAAAAPALRHEVHPRVRKASVPETQQVIITDAEGRVTFVNASFTAITGYSLSEVKGRTPGDVLQGPLTEAWARQILRRAIHDRSGCRGVQITNYRKDGSPFVVSIDIEPIYADNGVLESFVSVQTDVRERGSDEEIDLLKQWMKAVQGTSEVGLWQRDLDTDEAFWDATMFGLWGLSGPVVPSTAELLALMDRDSATAFLEARQRSVLPRGPGERLGMNALVVHIRRPDGMRRALLSNSVTTTDLFGRRVSVGSTQDVTESMQAQDASRVEREELLLAVEATGVGVWHEDLAGNILALNDAARRAFDLADNEMADPAYRRRRVAREHIGAVMALREQCLSTEASVELEYCIHRQDGSRSWVWTRRRPLLGPGGKLVGLIGAVTDVTQHHQAAARERGLATKLQLGLDVARVGLWTLDTDTAQVELDARSATMYGFAASSRTLTRDQWLATVHAEDRARVAAFLKQMRSGPVTPGTVEFRITRADGQARTLSANFTRFMDTEGKVIGYAGAARDVTEERSREAERLSERMEAKLRAARLEQAEELAESRATLLAAVSHEVRVPLNAIVVCAELLRGELARNEAGNGEAPSTENPWLALLIRSAAQLTDLVQDLLVHSSLEDQVRREPRTSLALGAALDEVIESTRAAASEAGVSVVRDEALATLRVSAVKPRLRQVLDNLLRNAVKYNKRGGEVRLYAAGEVPNRIGLVGVCIEDTGLGMTPEQLSRLFNPFDRLGREQGKALGFGLGLHLAHQLVESMGGRVDVESRAGEGTRFTLWLARAGEGDSAASAASPVSAWGGLPGAPGSRSGEVLVIDDDEVSAMLVGAQLERAGPFEVSRVADVDGALRFFAAAEPRGALSLVLIDMQLGPVSGVAALDALRAAGFVGAAVAYTGDATLVTREQALRAGFADVWNKPLTQRTLEKRLTAVLREGAGRGDAGRARS